MSTETLEQNSPETLKLICDALQTEMGPPKGVIQIYNQDRRLPAAKGYFIDVLLLNARPFAVNKKYVVDPASTELVEQQTVNQQEIIQVDIFSYDDSARLSKINIIFALNSTTMQQLAEKWAFKIARIPASFVDASEVEASKRLNRYALTFAVLRGYQKTASAQTFTNFQIPPEKILINP